MKKLLLLTIALVSLNAFGQSKYEKGMMKAFDLWQNGKSWEAANIFERIAQAEADDWLPPYYVAQINIFNSFNEKDEEKLTAQLKKAQDFLNDAKAISKDNPEILVAQAQLYTAWVAFDGQRFGMTYAPQIAQLYNEAYKLEPENPRVAFGKVDWDLGTAQFFGQDTEPFCKDLEAAVALFDVYEPKGQFHPRGGDDYAKQRLEQACKKE